MDSTTNLDEELLGDALKLTGTDDRAEVINEALRVFVRLRRQRSILALGGKVKWEGDLDELRRGRWLDADR